MQKNSLFLLRILVVLRDLRGQIVFGIVSDDIYCSRDKQQIQS